MSNKKDLIRGELIGKEIEITGSNNQTLIGLKGEIIDETQNMLTLKTTKKQIKLIKSNIKIKIEKNEINGKKIQKRPEERIKTK